MPRNRNSKLAGDSGKLTLTHSLIGLGFVIAMLAGAVVYVVVVELRARSKHEFYSMDGADDAHGRVCRTEECRKAGAFFNATMNPNADPCENFYEYICGGWNRTHHIPPGKTKFSHLELNQQSLKNNCIALLSTPKIKSSRGVVDNAKVFFQTCVETENSNANGKSTLKKFLSKYVDIPILGIRMDKPDKSWEVQIARIYRDFYLEILIGFTVVPDKDVHKMAMTLKLPSFGAQGGKGVTTFRNKKKRYEDDVYSKYITESFCFMLGRCNDRTLAKVRKNVRKIVDFEVRVSSMASNGKSKRGSLRNLKKSIPQINWQTYLIEVLRPIGTTVSDDTHLVTFQPEFFLKLGTMLEHFDKETISTYIGWRLLQKLGPITSKDFRDIEREFHEEMLVGYRPPVNIKNRCFNELNYHLPYAVSRVYVTKHFTEKAKAEVDHLVKNLIKSMRNIMKSANWMDDETKRAGLKKLSKLKPYIGYPRWILNDKKLSEYYPMKPMKRNDILGSYRIIMQLRVKMTLETLRKGSPSNIKWTLFPTTVNAGYNPSQNTISFPAAVLQPPFYFSNVVKSVTYGPTGLIIGHEITHAFDDKGSQYNSDGVMENWWSESSKTEFNKRKQCFIEQYGNVTVPRINWKLNSVLTIGEDISDNGGIREAFQAFKMEHASDQRLPGMEHLTPNQLFLISSGTVHCSKFTDDQLRSEVMSNAHSLGMIRATIPLANTGLFSTVFNCKKGTKMNPDKKCVMW